MLAQATILSVVVSFWMTIMWGGWPFSLIRNKLVSGIALLVGGYVVAAVLFEVFFDYGVAQGCPGLRRLRSTRPACSTPGTPPCSP